jgi:hypothetical protein
MSADVRLALAKKYYRLKVRWKSRNLRGENSANNEVKERKKETKETKSKSLNDIM